MIIIKTIEKGYFNIFELFLQSVASPRQKATCGRSASRIRSSQSPFYLIVGEVPQIHQTLVADRGTFSMSAISPKHAPGASVPSL